MVTLTVIRRNLVVREFVARMKAHLSEGPEILESFKAANHTRGTEGGSVLVDRALALRAPTDLPAPHLHHVLLLRIHPGADGDQ